MILRSALLLGHVDPADQPAFDRAMAQVVVPAIATYPGIRAVSLRKTDHADPGAPPVYMQFDLSFDSLADMEAALASPVRAAVRESLKSAMGPFRGTVVHVVSELLPSAGTPAP